MWPFRKKNTGFVSDDELKDALSRGIRALLAVQEGDGDFPLFKWSARGRPTKAHSLFSTACILLSVGRLLPKDNLSRACAFLSSARRSDGTWVFDSNLGIPSDSDDTACALAALAMFDPDAVSATDSTILRSFWRTPEGPFQTWQAGNSKWNGPERDDAVVNGNVLLALKELGAPPSSVETGAALKLIRTSREGSRYYCSPISVSYTAVRAGFALEALPPELTARPAMKRDFLPAAQWLTMSNGSDSSAVKYLLSMQENGGCWPAEAWITGVMKPKLFWGGNAVSTAFCLEAINAALGSTAK